MIKKKRKETRDYDQMVITINKIKNINNNSV